MIDDPLNAPKRTERLAALRARLASAPRTYPSAMRVATSAREGPVHVNNHVHTTYSFSPYSPTLAAWKAVDAGLASVGIIDHDTVSGCAEMLEAGRILGIATTEGFELRVSAAGTALEGRRLNNPDSLGIMYVILHGIPEAKLGEVDRFLAPIRASREARNRRMVDRLREALAPAGLPPLDYERDVRAASCAADGGTVTERHILFALSRAIVERAGRGPSLVEFLRRALGVVPAGKLAGLLADPGNPFLLYDLLGALKTTLLERVFEQPDGAECVPAVEAVRLADSVGAIACYAYLGDVADSPTGDKKAERFEDAYLDELAAEVARLGFRAIAYMPPRNTLAQLQRVQRLCAERGLMEVSGVDINSPRQDFRCPEILRPEFSHLVTSTWALIAHEKLQVLAPRYGLFHPDNPMASAPLAARLERYADIGRRLDPAHPEEVERFLPAP